MLVDSHCHLDFPDLIENETAVLERMAENGVTHALCVSVKLETLPAVIGLAGAGWMFQAAYEQHIKVLQIGDDTGQRLQMRGLNHDQEGAEHGQR